MKLAYAIAVAAVAAIVGLALLGWRAPAERSSGTGPPRTEESILTQEATGVEVKKERRRWQERIAAVGAEAAYAEFKREYAARHFSAQHIVAHIIGELLYETAGMAGLAVCDASFAFGCYHSLFGAAIARNGDAVVADLDRECVTRLGSGNTGCQHGIGHGILEHLGGERLGEALGLCAKTTTIHPLLGCTSGVFMEYNTPIIIGESAAQTLRPLDRRQPLAPCPTLIPSFRPSCYFELAPWWKSFFVYGEMGHLCATLQSPAEREACFQGIGYIIVPFSEYDIKLALAECRRMPTREGEILCRAGMWWSYFVVPERRQIADGACRDLAPRERSSCIQKGRLIQ